MSAQENGVNQERNQIQTKPMTLAEVRAELKATKGKKFWRSLDELAGTEEFQKAVEQEFPGCGAGVGGPGIAARVHETDGRVDGAGRAWPGAPSSPTSRSSPTSSSPRTWCWASRCISPRRSPWPTGRGADAGEERPVPAHQDRRQPGARIQPGLVGCIYAGIAAGPLRSGPVEAGHISW